MVLFLWHKQIRHDKCCVITHSKINTMTKYFKLFLTGLVMISTLAISAQSKTAVKGQEVTYTSAGTTLKGYVAYNKNQKGKRPAVIVVPEWWGNNDYSKMRANKLAALGYIAIAVDIYGDGKIAVQGSFSCNGAFIYDISNPDTPVLASWYNPNNDQEFLEAIVVGNRGYFGSGNGGGGVHIVDLSNPYSPVLLGVVDLVITRVRKHSIMLCFLDLSPFKLLRTFLRACQRSKMWIPFQNSFCLSWTIFCISSRLTRLPLASMVT